MKDMTDVTLLSRFLLLGSCGEEIRRELTTCAMSSTDDSGRTFSTFSFSCVLSPINKRRVVFKDT